MGDFILYAYKNANQGKLNTFVLNICLHSVDILVIRT